MKIKSLWLVVVCFVFCGCGSKRDIMSLFEEVAQKVSFKYKNYEISDYRESSYYLIKHDDKRYIARMPVSVDTLITLNRLFDSPNVVDNAPDRYAKPIATRSDEAIEIRDACLLFRSIWQISPKEIYLKKLETDQFGKVKLIIEIMSTKKEYMVSISPSLMQVEEKIAASTE